MKNTIEIQDEKLCKYEKKLEACNEMLNELDTLRELVKTFEQWKDKNNAQRVKVFNELFTSFQDQSEKIKKLTTEKCNLETENCKLQSDNSDLTNQLKTMQFNEKMLMLNLENCEKNKRCVQKEKCSIKVSFKKFCQAVLIRKYRHKFKRFHDRHQ